MSILKMTLFVLVIYTIMQVIIINIYKLTNYIINIIDI